MERNYERETLAVEERHWWYRGRRRIVADAVGLLPLPRPAEILDAGCGSGRNLELLAPLGAVTGLEPSAASLGVARERAIGPVIEGSIEEMPFPNRSFDLATSLDVLEHVNDARALRELRRVVRPGGFLLVTVPAYPRLWSSHDEANHHLRRYTRSSLLTAAGAARFAPIRTTYFNSSLLPAATLYRLVYSRRGASGPNGTTRSDLSATPGWLNGVLERPLLAEAALLRSGRGLPAGLSLMGVFR